nr:unnamed protein product [Digitaria exilis]
MAARGAMQGLRDWPARDAIRFQDERALQPLPQQKKSAKPGEEEKVGGEIKEKETEEREEYEQEVVRQLKGVKRTEAIPRIGIAVGVHEAGVDPQQDVDDLHDAPRDFRDGWAEEGPFAKTNGGVGPSVSRARIGGLGSLHWITAGFPNDALHGRFPNGFLGAIRSNVPITVGFKRWPLGLAAVSSARLATTTKIHPPLPCIANLSLSRPKGANGRRYVVRSYELFAVRSIEIEEARIDAKTAFR